MISEKWFKEKLALIDNNESRKKLGDEVYLKNYCDLIKAYLLRSNYQEALRIFQKINPNSVRHFPKIYTLYEACATELFPQTLLEQSLLQKIQAINLWGGSIFNYFQERKIEEVYVVGNWHDRRLLESILIDSKYSCFDIKQYYSLDYEWILFLKTGSLGSIRLTSIKNIESKNKNSYFLNVHTSNFSDAQKKLSDLGVENIVDIDTILKEVFVKSIVINQLNKISNTFNVPILICMQPWHLDIKNRTEHEQNLASISTIRSLLEKDKNFSIPALARFGVDYDYICAVTDIWIGSVKQGVHYLHNRSSQYVNVVNHARLTTDQPEKYDHTIYIFGSSVAYGIGSEDADTISSYLQRIINLNNKKYLVMNYANFSAHQYDLGINFIKEFKFKQGDIILWISHLDIYSSFPETKNIKLLDNRSIFDRPHDLGEIFIDKSHPNKIGNEVIAQHIYEKMLKDNLFAFKKDLELLENQETNRSKEKMLIPVSEYENLEKYKALLREHKADCTGKIGSIVVNCNPFTMGHKHLISYAASKVDYLYLFVVEEDKSFFPFTDRFELVKKGVAEFPNITVIPSGRFIISSLTFAAYSSKAELQDEIIDPSDDVEIFATHIAPTLGITRRFAGEEPLDNVTRQYNNAMRRILPQHGIEFEVIVRKESGGAVISASRVRALLEKKQFDEIAEIVPETTLIYLKERFG
ncbi:hypothetical protein [Stenoxybacter acetivorans]|uniref:hypothetical protein n=1 Tax=Stenoxybacter acetivorans TaxID=422441 RepID=UPI00068E31C5|nr:hypothetical protein [Stenoxybacter acetivorans]